MQKYGPDEIDCWNSRRLRMIKYYCRNNKIGYGRSIFYGNHSGVFPSKHWNAWMSFFIPGKLYKNIFSEELLVFIKYDNHDYLGPGSVSNFTFLGEESKLVKIPIWCKSPERIKTIEIKRQNNKKPNCYSRSFGPLTRKDAWDRDTYIKWVSQRLPESEFEKLSC